MTDDELIRLRRRHRLQMMTAVENVAVHGMTVEEAADAPMPVPVRDDKKAAFIELLRVTLEDGRQ